MTFSQSLLRIALATAFLLSIPLVAMQFTPEVNWTLSDFIIGGGLLLGAGLAYTLVARMGRTGSYRLGAALAVGAGLLLVWGNLAVGFIGSEDNPANLLYGAVLAVALGGAVAARGQARGMRRAMWAAALVQVLVPLVALAIWRPEVNAGVAGVLGLNTAFAGLWAGAGWLFGRAAQADAPGLAA